MADIAILAVLLKSSSSSSSIVAWLYLSPVEIHRGFCPSSCYSAWSRDPVEL